MFINWIGGYFRRGQILGYLAVLAGCFSGSAAAVPVTLPIAQKQAPDPTCILDDEGWYYCIRSINANFDADPRNLGNDMKKIRLYKGRRLSSIYTNPVQQVDVFDTSKGTADGYPCPGHVRSHVWAPEIHKIDGRWHIIARGNIGNFMLESLNTDPMVRQSWKYKGTLRGGLDASIMVTSYNKNGNTAYGTVSENGFKKTGYLYEVYSSWDSTQTVHVGNLVNDNSNLANEGCPNDNRRWRTDVDGTIITPTLPWETIDGPVAEGPYAFYKNNSTYIHYSGSYCGSDGYNLGAVKYNGGDPTSAGSYGSKIRSFWGDGTNTYGVGHHSWTVTGKGDKYVLLYHGKTDHIGGLAGEESREARFKIFSAFNFNGDVDMPNFGSPDPSGTVIDEPLGNPYYMGDDFEDGNTGNWSKYEGSWSEYSGQFQNAGGQAKAVANDTNFSDFTYEADVTTGTGNDAGLIFRVNNAGAGADAYQGYYAGLVPGTDQVVLGKANNSWTQISSASMTIDESTQYHMKVVAIGSSIKVYVNDVPKISVTDADWTTGAVGVRSFYSDAKWDRVVVRRIAPTITLSQTAVHANETFTVTYGNGPGLPTDWIGIYRDGDTPGVQPSQTWSYTSEKSGTMNFSLPEAGTYFVAFFTADGYSELAQRKYLEIGLAE